MGTAAPLQSGTACSARITVQTPDGGMLSHIVTPDDNLIVGSSPNCSLQLESSDVAAMHCLFTLEHGRLSVQDWYTTSGTFVNGERIQHPVSVSPGDEIRIGDFLLTAEFVDADSEPTPSSKPKQADPVPGLELEPRADIEDRSENETAITEIPDSSIKDKAVPSPDSDRPRRELEQLRKRVTDLELENEELRLKPVAWGDSANNADADPFDAELVDLLKSEIEQLQDEIAQRDARIAELQEDAACGIPGGDSDAESSDTAVLVERLEALLEELQLGDERVATLEDLLRAADEATRAEQEERRQLGAWVKDIEDRISEYEAGWNADKEAMQNHIDELNAERQRFDQRLRDMSERQGSSAQTQVIEELREEIEQLTQKWKSAEECRLAMRETIDSVEFQNAIETQEQRIEQRMREERLELAQEHAQMARERAELTRLKAEIDRKSDGPERKLDDATCRMQAFREHLKDIHKEEKQERETGGLSSRLARLWKRLDGR